MFTDKSSWLKNGLGVIRPIWSKKKKKDSINEKGELGGEKEWTYAQYNQRLRVVVLVGVGFPGGGNMASQSADNILTGSSGET